MAKYNREFLVPYLRDVCALQLALNKLRGRLAELEYQKRRLEQGVYSCNKPNEPYYDSENGIFLLVLGIFTSLLSILIFRVDLDLFGWFFLFGGLIEIISGVVKYSNVSQENFQKEKAYKDQLAVYQQTQTKNSQAKQSIPAIENEMRQCRLEIKRANDALTKVYCANVVPSHYRKMYAAVFLYDWFSTGQSDDLDMALNMFVLEEIKEKLDRIIANQETIILNQYLQLAEQRSSMELQKEHTAMLENKLNQINASNEERNTYLAMIDSNISTIAYFSAANYITRL